MEKKKRMAYYKHAKFWTHSLPTHLLHEEEMEQTKFSHLTLHVLYTDS